MFFGLFLAIETSLISFLLHRWSPLSQHPYPVISSVSWCRKVSGSGPDPGWILTMALRRRFDQPGRPGRGNRTLRRMLCWKSVHEYGTMYMNALLEAEYLLSRLRSCADRIPSFVCGTGVMWAVLFRKPSFNARTRDPSSEGPWMRWRNTVVLLTGSHRGGSPARAFVNAPSPLAKRSDAAPFSSRFTHTTSNWIYRRVEALSNCGRTDLGEAT